MGQVLIFVWLAGTILRIWRMARFFQIEGYESRRYARWLFGKLDRFVVWRALVFMAVALLISLALDIFGQDTPLVYLLIWGAAGALSVVPEPSKEIKQKFKLTPRAARLLVTAFALATLLLIGTVLVLGSALAMNDRTEFAVVSLVGAGVYHVAAMILPIANLVNFPVEAGFRRLFRARARRVLREKSPVVIGITGSYGKTSTKHYLAHILGARYTVLATPKSYNTLMGVCMVINNELAKAGPVDYFIVEMGAYVEGEIRSICALTQPQISLVTAVGPQHLERFGSLEAIARAKYEIVAALPEDGVAVFNWDNHYVRAMYEKGYPATRIGVSWENAEHATQLRFLARNVQQTLNGLEFDVIDTADQQEARFSTGLMGLHTVTNILLAIAVARHLGLTLAEIAVRVASLESAEHRLQRRTVPGGITIIDDAYSANPVGAQNVLDVLALHTAGRRVLITPGIVELGPLQQQENVRLGHRAAQVCTDIVLVGNEQTRPIQQGLSEASFDPERLTVYETREEAIAWFRRELQPGDTVLFLNDLPDTYL